MQVSFPPGGATIHQRRMRLRRIHQRRIHNHKAAPLTSAKPPGRATGGTTAIRTATAAGETAGHCPSPGPGVFRGPPLASPSARKDGYDRISHVPGGPHCLHAPLSDPGGTGHHLP
jgi:hypothetical protein